MKLYLRDIQEEMVDAWSEWFKDVKDVEVSCGDILELEADAVVSPANSWGFLDGGIDAAYRDFFGEELEKRLRTELKERYDSELPVGQAVIIPTEHPKIKWFISAPTMRIPQAVHNTPNAYLAFRAALRKIRELNGLVEINSVLCPGLCTAIGCMPFKTAAKQMFFAYYTNWLRIVPKIDDWTDAVNLHLNMLS